LDEEEKDGLRIKTISTRGELDEFEQQNIGEALQWTKSKKLTVGQILNKEFIKTHQKRMYGGVWKWAGSFRKLGKNIGIEWFRVGESNLD
jgi:fido (protein-threonine AMPylation protein)